MDKGKKGIVGISIIAAIPTTGLKFLIGLLTGSFGILAKVLHSGLTLAAEVITYFSVSMSINLPTKSANTVMVKLKFDLLKIQLL